MTLRLSVCAAMFWVSACGPRADHTHTLEEVRAAMAQSSSSPGDRALNNDLAIRAVEEGAFENLRRDEVINAIGRGTPCSVRPVCGERGFEDDDWIYDIGNDPAAPSIILGFDTSGRVSRSTYITH